MTRRSALIIVDVQHDFLPGGALAVPHGDAVIEPLLAEARSGRHDLVVASQDWHPLDHSSFELNGGPWPVHCVAGDHGAEIHRDILAVASYVVRKGTDPAVEQYSAFEGRVWTYTASADIGTLHEVLQQRGVTHLTVGGLAREYCVASTAASADDLGYRVEAPSRLTRGVHDAD
jgi:nicotinamidase-related amidase